MPEYIVKYTYLLIIYRMYETNITNPIEIVCSSHTFYLVQPSFNTEPGRPSQYLDNGDLVPHLRPSFI